VLVEIMATGICHTDAYTLDGLDSEGLFPSILGHEGAGVVREVGPGVTSVKPGDHVIPLYTPECGKCKTCLSGKSNLCTAIRATQGKGLMPDGTSRFSYKGETIFHYMGCSTFSNFTVLPEIAVAKNPRGRAVQDQLLHRLRSHHRGRRSDEHCQSPAGRQCCRLRAWGHRPKRHPGRQAGRCRQDRWHRHQPGPRGVGPPVRHDRLPHTKGMSREDIVAKIVEITDGGADYSFDATGNVEVMRTALECCHRGWGTSVIIGVAESGKEIATRPFQLVTGRNWRGTAFGGAKGRTDVPKIVDMYMDGKIAIDPMITHCAGARRHQRRAST
jgi:S-(hydroxymethyl)glutathione dehydrogenase/alcohol dehydrogenase